MFDSSTGRDGNSADFLMVGGGTVGSAPPARLSEGSLVGALPATRNQKSATRRAWRFP
jgi:hypothetical protein